MNENFKVFPAGLLKNFRGSSFEVKKDGGGMSIVYENALYRIEIPVECEVGCGDILLKETASSDAGAEILCLTEDGEETVIRVCGDGKAVFYDTRPADTSLFTPLETINECSAAALDKMEWLGEEFLNDAEKELVRLSPFIDFLIEPKLCDLASAEHFEAAAEYTKELYPELSAEFSALSAVKKSRFIKVRSTKKIRKLLREHLERDFDENKYLSLCSKANEGCAEKVFLEKEKFESVKASLTYLLTEAGYSGSFPSFTKDEKYISFSISYLNYENENGEFFYDLAAAFGVGGRRPAAYRDIVGEDKLSLPALSLADGEREEKLAMYVRSLDLILDGKRPPKEFFSLDGIKMSDIISPSIMNRCAVMLIVFSVVFAVLGFYWKAEAFGVAAVLVLSGIWLFLKGRFNSILVPCKKERL